MAVVKMGGGGGGRCSCDSSDRRGGGGRLNYELPVNDHARASARSRHARRQMELPPK